MRPPASRTSAWLAQLGAGDHVQQVAEVVQRLHGRCRVVDRGRECLDRDVDEDADRERGILVDRPLDPERHHPAEAGLGAFRVIDAAVHADHRSARWRRSRPRGGGTTARSRVRSAQRTRPAHRLPGLRRMSPRGRREPASAARATRGAGPPAPLPPRGTHACPGGDTSAATATGRSRWTKRSRKSRNSSSPRHEERPGDRHAEIRDEVGLDAPEQRERVRRASRRAPRAAS